MLGGLVLQATGLALPAARLEPGVGYGSLVLPPILAGIGISMVFPGVANAVTWSFPLGDAGVAAGVNNALRELGGVFGVAEGGCPDLPTLFIVVVTIKGVGSYGPRHGGVRQVRP